MMDCELCVTSGGRDCRLNRCGAYHRIYKLEPLSAVSRMVALISHDLRHPLTAILANAEFLTQANISEMQRNDLYQEIRCADRPDERAGLLIVGVLHGSLTRFGPAHETSLTPSSGRSG